MAELGLAIAGLASIAEVVCTRLFKYIQHVRNAEKEVLALTERINSLQGTLWRIKNLTKDSNLTSDFAVPYNAPIHACVSLLDEIRDKLSSYKEDAKNDPLLPVQKKWKWPFSRPETLDLTNKIQSYEASLGLMLTADSLSATLRVLNESKTSHDILKEVQHYFQAASQIKLDEEKQKLLSLTGPYSPLTTLKTNVRLWRPGTCIWFTEGPELAEWLATENSKLWTFGIPGAGKSILAGQIIQKALSLSDKENGVAYFFCDYKRQETQTPRNILGSLAEQLARQNNHSFGQLQSVANEYSLENCQQRWDPDCDDLFQLIVQMSENFRSVSILVDGLDECGDHIVEVTRYLSRLGELSGRIKTFLSSRQLVEIQDIVQKFQSICIAAQSTDIRLYVAYELESRMDPTSIKHLVIDDQSLKGEIMDALISKARGMFRWVAVQLDYFSELPSDYAIREALVSLPPDLAQSYERLLHLVNKKPIATQRLVQYTLMWLTADIDKISLSVEALLEAVSVTLGSRRFESANMPSLSKVLRACGSLVRLNTEENVIELAHFTVSEFLSSIDPDKQKAFSNYKIGGHAQSNYLVLTTLTYICYEDFWPIYFSLDEYRQLRFKFAFVPSAVQNLAFFLSKCDIQDERINITLLKFFDAQHPNSLIFWLCQMTYGSWGDSTINCDSFIPQPVVTINYAAMLRLPGICKRLIDEGQSSNASSPHGTPLDLALMGVAAIDSLLFCSLKDDACSGFRIWETVQVLLDCGADIHVESRLSVSFGVRSTLAAAAILIPITDKPFRELVALKAPCKLDCLEVLERFSREGLIDKADLIHLVHSIQVEQIDPSNLVRLQDLQDRMSFSVDELSTGPQIDQLLRKGVPLARKHQLFFNAVEYDRVDTVIHLIDHRGISSSIKNGGGETALHVAAGKNSKSTATTLLDRYGIDPNIRNLDGQTALHVAARHYSVGIVNVLLDRHGVDPNMKDYHGRTALHVAAVYHSVAICEILLGQDGVEPNMRDYQGRTALHVAAEYNSVSICKILLGRSGVGSTKKDGQGEAALTLACGVESPSVAKAQQQSSILHLARHRVNIDERDHEDMTALHLAGQTDAVETARLLIEFGADVSARTGFGWAPVHYAVNHGSLSVLKLFEQEKIGWKDPCTFFLGSEKLENAQLHHLAAASSFGCLRYLLDFPDYFKVTDMAGEWSPLTCAVWAKHERNISILLEKGAAASKSARGRTELHDAASLGLLSISGLLMEYGFDPTARDSDGLTPPLLAERYGFPEIARSLKHHSANIRKTSSQVESLPLCTSVTTRQMRRQARIISKAMEVGDLTVGEEISSQEGPIFSPCQICGECDLFIHALSYNEKIALDLFKRGYKINGFQGSLHGYCRTALHLCAEYGNVDLLNLVLDRHPELLYLDTEVHPIHLAILNHQNDCVKAMLDRSKGCWFSVRGKPFHSEAEPRMVVADPVDPARREECTRLKWLQSPDLSLAILSCLDGISSEILAQNPARLSLGMVCRYGPLLPLHCAAYINNAPATRLLLGYGAEKEAIAPGGSDSALCVAVGRQSMEVVEILLEKEASVYPYDSTGTCGISLLACYCPDLFLKYRRFFDLDIHPNNRREPLMHQLLNNGDTGTEAAQMVLSEIFLQEGDISGTSHHKLSTRQLAFHRDWQEASAFFVNAGIDFEAWDEHCGSVLNTRWCNDQTSTLKRLIRRIGCEKSMWLLNRKPVEDSTPLYNAALMGQQDVARTLMHFGADVNADGGQLGTPLMAAAAYGRLCIVKDFVNAGAALSCFSSEENRFHCAVDLAKHFPEIQRWLLVGRWSERRFITYEA